MDPYHRQSLKIIFLTFAVILFSISGYAAARSPEDFGRTWQDLPVIPEFSDHAREILKAGIAAGHEVEVGGLASPHLKRLPGIDVVRVLHDQPRRVLAEYHVEPC